MTWRRRVLALVDAHRRVVVVAEQELRLDEDDPRQRRTLARRLQHRLQLVDRSHVGDVEPIAVVQPDRPDVPLEHPPGDALGIEHVEDRVVLQVAEDGVVHVDVVEERDVPLEA